MADPSFHLKLAADFPYDWNQEKDATPEPAMDWAHAAARGVLSNLGDRRDIKHALERVDIEIRIEIVEDLAAIIRAARAADPS